MAGSTGLKSSDFLSKFDTWRRERGEMTYDPVNPASWGRTACETGRNYAKYPLTVAHTHTHAHTSTVHICMWIIHLLCEDLFLFLEKKKNRQCTILLDSIKQEGQAGLLSHASINGGHLSKKARWIETRITQHFSKFKDRIPKSACKTSKLNQ